MTVPDHPSASGEPHPRAADGHDLERMLAAVWGLVLPAELMPPRPSGTPPLLLLGDAVRHLVARLANAERVAPVERRLEFVAHADLPFADHRPEATRAPAVAPALEERSGEEPVAPA